MASLIHFVVPLQLSWAEKSRTRLRLTLFPYLLYYLCRISSILYEYSNWPHCHFEIIFGPLSGSPPTITRVATSLSPFQHANALDIIPVAYAFTRDCIMAYSPATHMKAPAMIVKMLMTNIVLFLRYPTIPPSRYQVSWSQKAPARPYVYQDANKAAAIPVRYEKNCAYQ